LKFVTLTTDPPYQTDSNKTICYWLEDTRGSCSVSYLINPPYNYFDLTKDG